MKSHILTLLIVTSVFGCQDGSSSEFEKRRKAHCDSIPETQKVVVEKFDKAFQILGQIDLKSSPESFCERAAAQLEDAIVATDNHKESANIAAKSRPKDMTLSQSGIVLSDRSKPIKEFLPKVRSCKNVSKIQGLLPWIQQAVKTELDSEHKACRKAAKRK